MSITVTDVTHVLQMLEASRNASRFADTIEYVMVAQTSGITEHVTFWSKLFVDTWARWAGSVSPIYLYILENLHIERHFLKEKKMEKKKKNEEQF